MLNRITHKEESQLLLQAAKNGNVELAKELIAAGANIEAKEKEHGFFTPLQIAAGMGHLEMVNLLIEKNANLEAHDRRHGHTPLSIAARRGQLEVVKLLIEKGANIEGVGGLFGWMYFKPLETAIKARHEEIVQLLVENKADVNVLTYSIPLILGVQSGSINILNCLLAAKANVNGVDRRGQTPLMVAAEYNAVEMIKRLLQAGAEVNAQNNLGETALMYASCRDNLESVQLLLQSGAKTDIKTKKSRTVFNYTYHNKNIENVLQGKNVRSFEARLGNDDDIPEALLCPISGQIMNDPITISSGVTLDRSSLQKWFQQNNYPESLICPVTKNKLIRQSELNIKTDKIMEDKIEHFVISVENKIENFIVFDDAPIILEPEEKPTNDLLSNQKESTPAQEETQSKHSLVNKIRKMTNNITHDEESVRLLKAASEGNIELMEELITKGAKLEIRDENGLTPLACAANAGKIEAVKFLIAKKAKLEARDKQEWTPLMHAVYKGHSEMVKFLIYRGANPHVVTHNGSTLLMIAVVSVGHSELVPFLLEHIGLDVNIVDQGRWTALLLAAEFGELSTVKLLVEQGAKIETRPSALAVAAHQGHANVVHYLLSQGADVNRTLTLSKKESTDYFKLPRTSTPLTLAIRSGSIEAVKFLLAAQANVNGPVTDLPLTVATETGNAEIVKLLLEAGSDVNIKNANNKTALSIAQEKNYLNVMAILQGKENDAFQGRLSNYTGVIPHYLKCPLSKKVMNDPITIGGITFDRQSVEDLFRKNNNPENVLCPITRRRINCEELMTHTNLKIKNELEDFVTHITTNKSQFILDEPNPILVEQPLLPTSISEKKNFHYYEGRLFYHNSVGQTESEEIMRLSHRGSNELQGKSGL